MQKNYYEILEVSENASPEVIEKAYKALVKKYHPDLQPEGKKQEAESKIKTINEAYGVLSDTNKKANYDNQLKSQKIQAERAKYEQIRREQQNSNIHSNNTNPAHSQPTPQKRPIKPTEQVKKNSHSNDQFIDNSTAARDAYNDAYQSAYQKAYIDTLKNMGYEIRYEKTFKERLQSFFSLVFAIIVLVIVCFILWHIPPIKNYLINLYNSNELVKILVDIIYEIFSNLISLFK